MKDLRNLKKILRVFKRWKLTEKNLLIIYSGVENENEILSCAQFEAQQEQSIEVLKEAEEEEKEEELISDKVIRKDIDIAVVDKVESVEKTTIIKKLVLPVEESLSASGTTNTIVTKPVGNVNGIGIGVTAIQPITAIKVNNCEIINVRRPRSVTASIFGQHPTKVSQTSTSSVVCVNRGQSVTAKLFAASPTLSSLGLPVGATPAVTAQQRPQNVTNKIFAPRTEEMNKGFLMFSEDESGLTSKYFYQLQNWWIYYYCQSISNQVPIAVGILYCNLMQIAL